MSAPGVRFRPPTRAIQKSSFHRYLQYYLAIIYLIRPASRPGFSFPTLRPWISVLQILRPGFTPGFVPRQLSCPLPGRARNSVPPRGNFGLAARIFHPRLRAPATVVQRPGCARGPILPGALPRGGFCLAVRQHLKRPPPRWSGYTIANLTEQKRGRSRKPASQEPPPAYSYRVSSGFAEPRGPPGFTHRPAPYPAIPAAGPAPVRTVYLRLVRCCASCWRRSSS